MGGVVGTSCRLPDLRALPEIKLESVSFITIESNTLTILKEASTYKKMPEVMVLLVTCVLLIIVKFQGGLD